MKAIDNYTDALTNALHAPELDEELERLTGDFVHPYLREIPLDMSVEDARHFRNLQRRMVSGEGRFDNAAVELLTAGKISLSYQIADHGVTAKEMRSFYSDLPSLIDG